MSIHGKGGAPRGALEQSHLKVASRDSAPGRSRSFSRSRAINARILRSLAAALVFTSLAHSAIAQSLGEHPAVLVARTWNNRGIDPNTFIVRHPAGPIWLNASPTAKSKAARDPTSRGTDGKCVSGK